MRFPLFIHNAYHFLSSLAVCDDGNRGRDVFSAVTERVGIGNSVGPGAIVLSGVTVGPRAAVAAGAGIIRDVPAW